MTEQYDPEKLEALVAEALSDVPQTPPERVSAASFTFPDTRLFERLSARLGEYIPERADVTNLLDQLRSDLFDGIQRGDLRSLHGVVRNCRKCPLVAPNPQLPAWNVADPDVVFVADTPWSGSPGDQHLTGALRDAGFSSKQICYTSTVRCFPQEARPPSDDEVTTCSSRYLFDEIELLQPKLVVALGSIPASTLLGGKIKITEERGRTMWVGPWPVLVTYSPAYVLKAKGSNDFAADLAKAHTFVYGN